MPSDTSDGGSVVVEAAPLDASMGTPDSENENAPAASRIRARCDMVSPTSGPTEKNLPQP